MISLCQSDSFTSILVWWHLSERIRSQRSSWGCCHSELAEKGIQIWVALNYFLLPVSRDPQVTLSPAHQSGERNESLKSGVLFTKTNYRFLFGDTVRYEDERKANDWITQDETKQEQRETAIDKELKHRPPIIISIRYFVSLQVWRDFVSNESEHSCSVGGASLPFLRLIIRIAKRI